MKNVCTQNPNSLSEKEDRGLEFDYVDIGSVSFEKGIFKSEHYTFKDAPSRARKIVKNGDIIYEYNSSGIRTYKKIINPDDTYEEIHYDVEYLDQESVND